MSRTFKDISFNYIIKGTLKLRRNYLPCKYFHYHNHPSWWNRLTTTRRRRRENRIYESTIKRVVLADIDLHEPHLNWNKPKQYYW